MAKRLPSVDPTVKFTKVVIDGKEYQLSFDLGSLAEAESRLNANGHNVSLLRSMDFSNMTIRGVQVLFACALYRAQPEITFEHASALVKLTNIYIVWDALYKCWSESVGVGEEKKGEAADEASKAEA